MKKKIILCISALALTLVGCQPIVSDSADSGNYATQNPLSAIEYSIFMNKQITVFTTQLTTHMSLLINSGGNYENIIPVAEETLRVMEATLDEVIVTYPASTYEDDRETTILVMKTTVEHMKGYIQDLKDNKVVTGYTDSFQNDYYALTGQANLYYQ